MHVPSVLRIDAQIYSRLHGCRTYSFLPTPFVYILFSRVTIVTNAEKVDALSLTPMAALPSHQRLAIGTELVEAGLRMCREQGESVSVVLGHPEFYRRFGFSAELASHWFHCSATGKRGWVKQEWSRSQSRRLHRVDGRCRFADRHPLRRHR